MSDRLVTPVAAIVSRSVVASAMGGSDRRVAREQRLERDSQAGHRRERKRAGVPQPERGRAGRGEEVAGELVLVGRHPTRCSRRFEPEELEPAHGVAERCVRVDDGLRLARCSGRAHDDPGRADLGREPVGSHVIPADVADGRAVARNDHVGLEQPKLRGRVAAVRRDHDDRRSGAQRAEQPRDRRDRIEGEEADQRTPAVAVRVGTNRVETRPESGGVDSRPVAELLVGHRPGPVEERDLTGVRARCRVEREPEQRVGPVGVHWVTRVR